jgi:UDP-N-acetyl-D-mannosaminuronic acid dehydrogenase
MINVIGLGYIGLPTALILAANKMAVVGTDCKADLVAALNDDALTFEEKEMHDIFVLAKEYSIVFSTSYQRADMYIIAVPTPFIKETKKIDPQHLVDSFSQVLSVCEDNAIVIIESTVSPGTIDRYIRPLIGKKPVRLAHAPERIIPGNMIHELINNSRTIGADDWETGQKVKEVYSSFCKGEIVLTNIRTAEMSKVVENAFRDVNIAYANELARICRFAAIDVHEVIRIANMHPRVNILAPGPGVGGHCISVDPWFLVGDYPEMTPLINAARTVNDRMPLYVIERIKDILLSQELADKRRVGVYGLTYKENVNDTRESPTLQMLKYWNKYFATPPCVYDPFIMTPLVNGQVFSLTELLKNSDIIVVMVAHNELRDNIEKFHKKVIFDTRHTELFSDCFLL